MRSFQLSGSWVTRKKAALVALVVAMAGVLLAGTAPVRAQLSNTITTDTAVAQGGTITFAVTSPSGVTITGMSPIPCTMIGTLPAASVTYTCSSAGLPPGTVVQQTFSVPNPPIAETITYNANGPLTASSGATAATSSPVPCGGAGTSWSCSVTLANTVISGGTLVVTITPTGGSVQVNIGPTLACPLTGTLPAPTTSPATITYTCSAGQTVPASTVASWTVTTAPGGPPPTISATTNANSPAAFANVPAPTSEPINIGGNSGPVINNGGPGMCSGPGPGGCFYFGPPPPPSALIGATTIPLPAGWNLIGGSTGTQVSGAVGPLFTFQAGDTGYETLSPGQQLNAGEGYWAFIPVQGTLTITTIPPQILSFPLPLGAWIMIGNPSSSPVTLSGASTIFTFNPTINNYQPATTLQPGQGAWVFSVTGGTLTMVVQ
jgi:hypothetical protein